MTRIIYLDYVLDNYGSIIEIGAVAVENQSIIAIFHELVFQDLTNPYLFYRASEKSHCISPHTLIQHGKDEEIVKNLFIEWIKTISDSLTLSLRACCCNVQSIKSWIPSLESLDFITYDQVDLPSWSERSNKNYHLSAYKLKVYSRLLPCNYTKHTMDFNIHWKETDSPTHTQIAKDMYGYRCALINAFELAYYEFQLALYCCDVHFHHNAHQLIQTPEIEFTNTSNDALIFYDLDTNGEVIIFEP